MGTSMRRRLGNRSEMGKFSGLGMVMVRFIE
jgi:hypothetical protein